MTQRSSETLGDQQQAPKQDEKRPYVRPQLAKHGNVETLTQGREINPSCPLDV